MGASFSKGQLMARSANRQSLRSPQILLQSGLVFLLAIFLSSCGQQNQKEAALEDPEKLAEETEKLDDLGSDEMLSEGPKNKAPKPELSTEGKKTGKMIDGMIINQQNEFLGMTTLKLSKLGVRMESPTITCIMLPGKEAMAYNPRNGNCMQLTEKSAAMLAGSRGYNGPMEQKTKKLGTEKIAGINCIHYELVKYFRDAKTKQLYPAWSSELWACKDIGLPPLIIKDVARLTVMPPELGFPVRIEREARTTQAEHRKGENRVYVKRRVIDTTAQKKAKIDEGQFAYLDGFKTVKDEMQLMMSSDEDEMLGSELDEAPGKKNSLGTNPDKPSSSSN